MQEEEEKQGRHGKNKRRRNRRRIRRKGRTRRPRSTGREGLGRRTRNAGGRENLQNMCLKELYLCIRGIEVWIRMSICTRYPSETPVNKLVTS